MKWEKTVRDAALSTLAAVGGLFVFMFLTLIIFFPTTMVGITYDLGMDKPCLSFAKRAYKDTKDVYYIGIAFDTAVRLENKSEILSCAETLVEDEDFSVYCDLRDGKNNPTTYEQYVYGQICVTMYEQDKKEEAVERAFSYTVGFPRNNAIFRLTVSASFEKDSQTIAIIKEKTKSMDTSAWSDEEKSEYVKFLEKIG